MISLFKLLEAGDFSQKVDELARPFREKFAFPKIHQLGLVVENVEESAGELEQRGIGPFFLAKGSPVFWRERGEEKKFQGRMGLAYFQGIELELLEPGAGSDFYRQSLVPGEIIIQHLGFLVPEVEGWIEKLEQAGYPLRVRGRLKSGPLITDFAYMDTIKDAGLIIEFISWKFFFWKISPAPFARLLARLQKLSGKRCWKM